MPRSKSGANANRASSKGTASSSRSGRAGHSAHATTDHEEIRRWVESRGGTPACVKGTGGGGDTGMLRIDFPGYSGEQSLQHISWDEWFEKFDEKDLALLYQDQTAGGQESHFVKLVSRETAQASQNAGSRHGRGAK